MKIIQKNEKRLKFLFYANYKYTAKSKICQVKSFKVLELRKNKSCCLLKNGYIIIINKIIITQKGGTMTQQKRVIDFLSQNREMKSLSEIYEAVGAESYGSQAGVRGLLNKNTGRGKRYYIRRRRGLGLYTLTAFTRRAWHHINS